MELLGSGTIEELQKNPGNDAIKAAYTKLMHSPQAAVEKCINDLWLIIHNTKQDNCRRLSSQVALEKSIDQLSLIYTEKKQDELLAHVFDHCNRYFPNDIGTLSIFFLNIVEMEPGQAIFLAANQPHAYLSGDCIECMACSDNVIRAGLTPKFKDIDTLLEMLDYTGQNASEKFFQSIHIGPHCELFKPPVSDFAVVQIKVPASAGTECQRHTIANRAFGSIILVLKGNALAAFSDCSFELEEGSIVFVPATIKTLELTLKHSSDDDFVAYQALYNDFSD